MVALSTPGVSGSTLILTDANLWGRRARGHGRQRTGCHREFAGKVHSLAVWPDGSSTRFGRVRGHKRSRRHVNALVDLEHKVDEVAIFAADKVPQLLSVAGLSVAVADGCRLLQRGHGAWAEAQSGGRGESLVMLCTGCRRISKHGSGA